MVRSRKWSDEMLQDAVKSSRSIRQVLQKLGLVEAGGNYTQVKYRIKDLSINSEHFLGRGWNKGLLFIPMPARPLKELLVKYSRVQSFKLKKRLFLENIKKEKCELCGWSKKSKDGRIPVELDHINGDRNDNRLNNLRILCPNCHSLQLTHRGKNKKKA
ncbi:HNH endonuclease [Candidatus Nomurabacteria bacterium]|nr:HNH endonuclease [Candidatus Nomurabacteria bacterium]